MFDTGKKSLIWLKFLWALNSCWKHLAASSSHSSCNKQCVEIVPNITCYSEIAPYARCGAHALSGPPWRLQLGPQWLSLELFFYLRSRRSLFGYVEVHALRGSCLACWVSGSTKGVTRCAGLFWTVVDKKALYTKSAKTVLPGLCFSDDAFLL